MATSSMQYMAFIFVMIIHVAMSSSLTNESINVHIISHTHDDVGWLGTVDEYYDNDKCVRCILDNMLISLNANKNRTFTYVEMAFFEKWYTKLDETRKLNVKELVREGRLEFANGGWVMNDEATTNFQDIIDQMRLGMYFLKNEFDFIPKVAWSIDPFGHSQTNAYLLTKLGFEQLVMTRIDYREKEKRIKEKTLEFIWQPYYRIDGGTSSIVTHVTYGHYNPEYKVFPDILESNKDSVGEYSKNLREMYEHFREMSDGYPSKELMFLFGDDFTFKNANQNFQNIEALITAFSESEEYSNKINFIYSTPSKYFRTLLEKNITHSLTVLKGTDFFPYCDYKIDYWTGYFTSRPYLKGLVKDSGHYLSQASHLLLNYILNSQNVKKQAGVNVNNAVMELNSLRRELAILQHHDAVSGTAREKVSKYYISRLNLGIKEVSLGIQEIIEKTLRYESKGTFDSICIEAVAQKKCINKILTSHQLDQGVMVVVLYPGYDGTFPIKIKTGIYIQGITVVDLFSMNSIDADVLCDNQFSSCTVHMLINFGSGVKDKMYKLLHIKSSASSSNKIEGSTFSDSPLTLVDNEVSLLTYDHLDDIFTQKLKTTGEEITLQLGHGFYEYHLAKDTFPKNREGAYLMATDTEFPSRFETNQSNDMYYVGKTVTELNLYYPKSQMKVRVYPTISEANFLISVESIIYPHSNPNEGGYEFVFIADSNINNVNHNGKTEFFTDSNGMKRIKRVKDYRANFAYEAEEKVSSNFYPVNTHIFIKDRVKKSKKLNIFNDRSQAGTSLSKGEVLLVMNRWSDKDDRKGLADGINEESSSNIYFHVNHWITMFDSYDKNFLQYFTKNKPIYAIYTSNNISQAVHFPKDNNHNSNSNQLFFNYLNAQSYGISKLFRTENKQCLDINIFFLSEKQFLTQFMNICDPLIYVGKTAKCRVSWSEDTSDYAKIERMELNGITRKKGKSNGIVKGISIPRLFGFHSDMTYEIDVYDFETFLITLE